MNLDFDDSKRMYPGISKQARDRIRRLFINRVNRKLALQKNAPLNRFSLKCKNDVGPAPVIAWMNKVLSLDVSEVLLQISPHLDWPLMSQIDASNTMVPEFWESCDVSSTSLTRLTLSFQEHFWENHKSVSFDTPNLEYLEYTDIIADEYPKVKFDSLVEARLNIKLTGDQLVTARFSNDDRSPPEEMVGDATDFLKGICNVETLYLSDNTLEVFNFCCKPMPIYNNLIHLTIKADREVGWESLPDLLKNCPNLETLVFEGLLHRFALKKCHEDCLCKAWEKEDIPVCLSSSPVKVLEILEFGDIREEEDMDEMMEQVEYFLETMPNLEHLIIHYGTSIDEDVEEVLRQFQMVPREGLTKCKIQIISDNLDLSST